MNTVVCDANILIDLLQIDRFNSFLKLKLKMHVPPDIVDEVKQEIEDEGLLLSISDLQIVLKDKNENRYGFVSGINSESPILCSSCCFEDNEALCDLAPCRATERKDEVDGYFIKV